MNEVNFDKIKAGLEDAIAYADGDISRDKASVVEMGDGNMAMDVIEKRMVCDDPDQVISNRARFSALNLPDGAGVQCAPDCECGTYRHQIPMPIKGRVRYIDQCIANIVAALNAAGIETVASCCGHGKRPGSILLEDGREILILWHHEETA